MDNLSMKVSVITVSYNSSTTIKDTIESILEQKYRPLEYIIIDGGSSDRTQDIINFYDELFIKEGIEFRHICESDYGIYDAMNKGIMMAEGDWIGFMNSDDQYCNSSCIEEMISKWNGSSRVIYGNEILYDGKYEYRKKRNGEIDVIKKRLPFCHQGALVDGSLMRSYKFDTSYRITADYNFFLKLYLKGYSFQYVDIDIARYYINGRSRMNYKEAIEETFRVKVENGLVNRHSPIQHLKKIYWIIKTRIDVRQ